VRKIRKVHVAEKVAARVLFGIGAIAATLVFVRTLPEIVRYLRVRQM
jgi:hypothetical protein